MSPRPSYVRGAYNRKIKSQRGKSLRRIRAEVKNILTKGATVSMDETVASIEVLTLTAG
jgi:hypothetical protein